jgi:hypothetical protein
MMTRKDYVVTAEILRDVIAEVNETYGENTTEAFHNIETVQIVSEKLAEYFASDNPNFNEEIFFKAVNA